MSKRPLHCPRCDVLTPAVDGLYRCGTCGGFDPDGARSAVVVDIRDWHSRDYEADLTLGPIDGKPTPITARIK